MPCVRPVRSKPPSTRRRGLSGKGRKTFVTVCLWRCDDTKFINSYPPDGRRDSTCPWRAPGPQASEAGRKGRSYRTGRRDPAEQVTMDNASEGALRRRHGDPANTGYQAGPKREWSQARRTQRRLASIHTRPGVKHHPTVTENGHTEQGNPPAALGGRRYTEQATRATSVLASIGSTIPSC